MKANIISTDDFTVFPGSPFKKKTKDDLFRVSEAEVKRWESLKKSKH